MAYASIEEIKTIIRGLLVSSPEDLTVMKLRRDFRAQEGQDIPFFEYGFRDITSFLRSMPDVCRVPYNGNGPFAVVRPVESAKSAHVSSLVLRQRISANRKRRPLNTTSRRRSLLVSYKPANSCYTKVPHYNPVPYNISQNECSQSSDFSDRKPSDNIQNEWLQSSEFSDRKPSNNIIQNERLQSSDFSDRKPSNNITENECLQSSDISDMNPSNNNSEVSESFVHKPANSMYNGYTNSVETWLSAIEEKSEIQESYQSIPDAKTDAGLDLEKFIDVFFREVLGVEGLPVNEVQEILEDALSYNKKNSADNSSITALEILQSVPNIRIVNNRIYPTKFEISACKDDFPGESEICMKPDGINGGLEDDNANVCEKGDLTATAEAFVPRGCNEKVQRLERNLYSLMKDHHDGILGSELKEKYKMRYAAPLNFRTLGCETPWDLVNNMPHIFSYHTLQNGDFILFPSISHAGQKFDDLKVVVPVSKKNLVVPEITKRNVQWLMQGYPNGLFSKDFEQTYKDTFLEDIELKQMGLSSIEDFLNYMAELNIIKVQAVESDTWLFPSQNSINLTIHENPLPSQVIESEVDMKNLKERFPRDVIGPEKHVLQIEIPSAIEKSSMIELFVQEVNNPHHFWVTLCGEKYSRALDSLMDDLQAFYCSKSHSYRMPSEFIREGQDCVTQYVEEWHRARVTSIISATEVEVCFYDYGTRRIVLKDNIHYLHTAHSALPGQGIRAVLANIAPRGDKWTQEASKRFLQLIANKALIGIVQSVDRMNSALSLFLCDTSGEDDIYIHEVLVSEGYAVETSVEVNEPNKTEKNNLKIEETLEHEILFASEEAVDEERQLGATTTDNTGKLEKYPKWSINVDNIIQEDITPQSDAPEELQSWDTSRKSSQSSLPFTIANDNLDCPLPVSTSASLSATSSTTSTTAYSSVAVKTSDNSAKLPHKVAPPPGFSHITKCEAESKVCDKTESLTSGKIFRNTPSNQEESVFETSKVQTSHGTEGCEDREIPKTTVPEKIDQGQTVKGVSSGVNVNFSQDTKASYVPNSYTYPNWVPAQQTYSNFPAFPPSTFPPMNTLASLSLVPLQMPAIPNPLEYCSMWYYEHCRQQAFLQGMLAQQQMAASTFPPLPPGMYLPQNYSTLSSQRSPQTHMNISEVHSPEASPVLKTNSKENPLTCYGESTTAATQTEDSDCGSSDRELIPTNQASEASLPAKDTGLTEASEFKAKKNEDYTESCESMTCSATCECNGSLQTNDNNPDVDSPVTCAAAVDEVLSKETANGIVENSICHSSVQTNEDQNLHMFKSGEKVKSFNSFSEKETNKESHLILSEDTIIIDSHCSTNVKDSQGKIEKVNGSNTLEQIFTEESNLKITQVNKSLVDVDNFESNCHGKFKGVEVRPSQSTHGSQVCKAVLGENGLVLPGGKSIHDLPSFDQDGTMKVNIGFSTSQKDASNISLLESGHTEIKEQELGEEIFTDKMNEEILFHKDDCHEHEMIEKAQQECIMKTWFEQNTDTVIATKSQSRTVAVHNKLFMGGSQGVNKENKTDTLKDNKCFSSIPPLSYKTHSYGSSEKQGSRGIGDENDTKEFVDKFQVISDHVLGQEHQLTSSQASPRNSMISPVVLNDSYGEVLQMPSLETLCTEFGALSVSNELKNFDNARQFVEQCSSPQVQLNVDPQVTELQNNNNNNFLSISEEEDEEEATDSVFERQTSPSKTARPILGANLSKEVSAAFVSKPTQPAMIQKKLLTSLTGSPVRTKDSVSYDTLSLSQPVSWKTTWNKEELTELSLQRQGHDFTKNLSCSFLYPNSSKQSTFNRHRENPSSIRHGTSYQFVKQICLCRKKIYQINLDGRPYVLTDEIVSYFTPFNGRHVILKILEARKVEINFLELSRKRRPEFFECLDTSDIKCLSRGPTGNVIGSVHIVPLRSVPYMLRALNRDDATLSMDVKEEMEKFDPSDPYWSGKCEW